jgi:hypothetical protein
VPVAAQVKVRWTAPEELQLAAERQPLAARHSRQVRQAAPTKTMESQMRGEPPEFSAESQRLQAAVARQPKRA